MNWRTDFLSDKRAKPVGHGGGKCSADPEGAVGLCFVPTSFVCLNRTVTRSAAVVRRGQHARRAAEEKVRDRRLTRPVQPNTRELDEHKKQKPWKR